MKLQTSQRVERNTLARISQVLELRLVERRTKIRDLHRQDVQGPDCKRKILLLEGEVRGLEQARMDVIKQFTSLDIEN